METLEHSRRNTKADTSFFGNVPDKDRRCEALAAFFAQLRESVFRVHYRAIWDDLRPRSFLRVGAARRSKR